MSRRSLLSRSAAAVAVLLAGSPAGAQDVAAFFEENCAACHTIGEEGSLDLARVTERKDRAWLVRFMLDPDKVIRSGDPYAAALVKAADGAIMPEAEGLTPDLAAAILDYIESGGSAASPGDPNATAAPPTDQAPTAAQVEAGRKFYSGAQRLEDGGPSCISCHQLASLSALGGGAFGPDLTAVHTRLRGRRGLEAWLTNPPTPVMKAVYRNAPLEPHERVALAALFADTASRHPDAPARSNTSMFVSLGAGGAVLALVAMALVWSRRFDAVRRPMVEASRTLPTGDPR
jgi:mono/diheme cytochrome c family protein